CIGCHSTSGKSNEMFTDFKEHAIAVPQLVPQVTNNQFDGPGATEDFGREDFTGDPADRYRFRTPSLRNVAVEAAYMHDGAFTTLAAAIRHHLDAVASLQAYDPKAQGLPADLAGPTGPTAPLVAALDPRLATPTQLTPAPNADPPSLSYKHLLGASTGPARRGKRASAVAHGAFGIIETAPCPRSALSALRVGCRERPEWPATEGRCEKRASPRSQGNL